jgi:hypothetical protein
MSNAEVACYSGVTYGERPLAFKKDERKYIVKDVLNRWRLPEGKSFLVQTEEDLLFKLNYDETLDVWQIERF